MVTLRGERLKDGAQLPGAAFTYREGKSGMGKHKEYLSTRLKDRRILSAAETTEVHK